MRPAQCDQRWLDRFNLQVNGFTDLQQLVERSLIRHSKECMLMPGIELLRVTGECFCTRAES